MKTPQPWRAQLWTLLISVPAILCFVPGFAEHVAAGFAAFAALPEWYRLMVSGFLAAVIGERPLTTYIKRRKAAQAPD